MGNIRQRIAALLVTAASVALVAPASAADWTGIYLGGELGAGWSNGDVRHVNPPVAGPFDASFDGVTYGGHIGGQWQTGNIVLGIEGSYRGGTLDGNASCDIGNNDICELELKHVWIVDGRVGWAMSSLLFYASGGYANASYDMTQHVFAPAINLNPNVGSFDHNGYEVGGGIDKMISDNIIVGLEYQHLSFSDDQSDLHRITDGATSTWKHAVDMDIVQGRISYKF